MRENMKKSEERVGRKKAGRSKEQSPSHAEKGIFPTPGGWAFIGLLSGIHNSLILKLRKNSNICLKTFFLSEASAWQPLGPYFSNCRSMGSAWGDYCSVKHGVHILLGQGTGCWGFQVHEDGNSREHPQGCKEGAAGAEGFRPFLCDADVEDTGQDEGIGNKDC